MTQIQIQGISKRYGGVIALAPLDLELGGGQVHAICGENGAGKSTLNKILAGSVTPDTGTITIDGVAVPPGSVTLAESAGIVMVHQESAAFLSLSATDNHQLMREPSTLAGAWIDRKEMRRRTVESLASLGESFDPDVPLESRSLAQRQMVSIARALATNCRLLILDEPSASLSSRETDALFSAIQTARAQGVAILYVSHRMEEIFALSDTVTVLRDGNWVATKPTSQTTPEELIQLMVGRELIFSAKQTKQPGPPVLVVNNLTQAGTFHDINFKVHFGEVVVLAGLVGAGRSEIARAIFGIDPISSGSVTIEGEKAQGDDIALVPEDRQHEGLHLPLSLRDNMSMVTRLSKFGLIDRQAEASQSRGFMQSLSIKANTDLAPANSLSGGNQQKVLLGKWLSTQPKVLILDEPTRGVDVGAKAQIHDLIAELAAEGVAVLVISSELNEVLTLADRVLVIRQGKIAGELSRQEATQENILALSLPLQTEGVTEKDTKGGIKREYAVGGLLFLTLLLATVLNPTFLTPGNLSDMLVKVAPALILGSMMTLVILAREIDISVGSTMGLCAATLGIACSPDRMGLPVPVGVALCLGVGLLTGLFNGLLVTLGRVPSIIVTLGTLTIVRGITEIAMGGKWIEHLPTALRAFGTGKAAGVPYSILCSIVFIAIGIWITRRTRFGQQVFALGSNPIAAKLRGVPVNWTTIGVFVLAGFAAAVAALFSSTQLQVIESGFGNGFELVVIASVIVGGTSIRGGRGTIIGTVLGAVLLGIISTVLIFLKLGDAATYWERAIQGGFILLAVLGDHLGKKSEKPS